MLFRSNDTYGHLVGDDVIRAVSQVLLKYKRNEDFAARYGGEEFVVLLDNCKIEDAIYKAEQFREFIENLMPEGIRVTSSFGVTELKENQHSFDDMIKEADEALYRSKENGRNRVSY